MREYHARYSLHAVDAGAMALFKDRRDKKKRIGRQWPERNYRVQLRELGWVTLADHFRASADWLSRFCRRNRIALKRCNNWKSMPPAEKVLKFQRYFPALIRDVRPEWQLGFIWEETFARIWVNGGQVPFPFFNGKQETYTFQDPARVDIANGGDDCTKRIGTLQLAVRCVPTTAGLLHLQPRAAMVFRGKGTVLKKERHLYHPNVDVYFQRKAWVDGVTHVDWILKTLGPNLKSAVNHFLPNASASVKERVLQYYICDNLSAHTSRETRTTLSKYHTKPWFPPQKDHGRQPGYRCRVWRVDESKHRQGDGPGGGGHVGGCRRGNDAGGQAGGDHAVCGAGVADNIDVVRPAIAF